MLTETLWGANMVEIVLVSHADIAEGMRRGIELIMGEVSGLHAYGLQPKDGFEAFSRYIKKELETIYHEDGVLIMVDLFGGTPCNVSAIIMKEGLEGHMANVECISGLSLPMVLEAISMRDGMSLGQLKDHCMDAGRSGIKDIRSEFNLKA